MNRGEAAAPWFKARVRGWPKMRAALTLLSETTGEPWDEDSVETDLEWWADQIRMGRETRLPGRRVLVNTWRLPERKVKAILRDRWPDVLGPHPVLCPKLTKPGSWTHERPASVPSASRQRPASVPPANDEHGVLVQKRPASVPPASHERPASVHTRVPTEQQSNRATEQQRTPSGSPPQGPPRGARPLEPSAPKQPILVAPVQAPPAPPLPEWASKAKPKRCTKRRLTEVLLEVVSAVTRRPLEREWADVVGQEFRKGTREYRTIKAERAAGLVGGCLSLLRRLKWPDIEEWRAEALVVADAFHNCPDKLFARSVRGEGWADGQDRSESTQTFARQDVWEDRVTAALRWDANGRPPTPGGGARAIVGRARAAADFSIPDSIPFRTPSARRSA